jgi:hypothetical protein
VSGSCEASPHGPSPQGPSLAGPRTPGDGGEADPALAAALDAWSPHGGPGPEAAVYAVLPGARVFVPVVATLEEAETDHATGLRTEKSSSMSVVTLVSPSGATALPTFLSPAAMRRWRLDARPVPVSGREACLAALDGGHAAVVVDPAGARFPVDGAALSALADGWVPAAGGGTAAGLASRRVADGLRLAPPAESLTAAVRDALVAALAAEPAVAEAYVVDAAVGDEAPSSTVGLVLARDVAVEEVAGLAGRLQRALAPVAGRFDLAVLNRAQRAEAAGFAPPLWSTGGASSAAPASPRGPRRRWWRGRS